MQRLIEEYAGESPVVGKRCEDAAALLEGRLDGLPLVEQQRDGALVDYEDAARLL